MFPPRKALLLRILTVGIGLAATALPLPAHHAFAANYDAEKMVTMKGKVTRFEWKNPHAHIYVDEKKDAGNVVHWSLEGGSLGWLVQVGWRKDTLKAGETIGICGYAAKEDRLLPDRELSAELITMPDGVTMVFASEMQKCEETYHLIEP